jgi:hypothetical protein
MCIPHFFHESAHVVQCTADEVGMSLFDFVFIRGWTISRKSTNLSCPFGIRYSAFQAGLEMFEKEGIINNFRHKNMLIFCFSSLISKLDAFLSPKKVADDTGTGSVPNQLAVQEGINIPKAPSKEE